MTAGAGASTRRSRILVASALAARQWEWHCSGEAIARGAAAWETPPIQTYGAWLEESWRERGRGERSVLSASQSLALWRRVIAESETGATLIGHTGAAEWAAAAWALLNRWRIDPASLRAGTEQGDFHAFLDWCRRYRRALDARGWIDRGELEAALTEVAVWPAEGLLAADLGETYPARSALFAHLAARGVALETRAPPAVAARYHAARLPDAAHELRAAMAWAQAKLAANGGARIAIVVAALEQRADEVARCATAELGALAAERVWADSGSLAADPSVGAAVTALALLDAATPYAAFGRWLRSPFFAAGIAERSAKARLDRELRGDVKSQLPFVIAHRHAGLRDVLRARVPETAAALERALAEVGATARAAPSRWAHLWSRVLNALGWQPPPARHALLAWQGALDELAALTPIVGEVRLGTALGELERILQRAAARALPLRGIHVLRRIEDVGPGYDAAWATGFTDTFWPEPAHGNPLLPLGLQRSHAMPYSSPQDAARRSAATLEGLLARVPDVVVSWPGRVYDYETEPSPALGAWPTLPPSALERARATGEGGVARARETRPDAPPPLTTERLPGGAAALGRQARCPIRAFCQHRLGARPLEPIAFGVSARQRGIAAHRAAELLLHDRPTQATLVAEGPTRIAASVDGALRALFARARGALASLFELEAEQLARVLEGFLADEARRAPFRVRDVERTVAAAIGRWSLELRIDRIDELADGTLAVIDYKTSERASGADWFAVRLRDAQLPLYAVQSTEPVVAAVIARLTPQNAGYAGVWPEAAFPGRRTKGAPEDLRAHLAHWRAELETLASEFAAGDTRVFLAAHDEALESFAPLTRIHEQLALAGGTIPSW